MREREREREREAMNKFELSSNGSYLWHILFAVQIIEVALHFQDLPISLGQADSKRRKHLQTSASDQVS